MKHKIELSKVNGNEFEGYVLDETLTDDQLSSLNLKRGTGEVEVNGEFSVTFKHGEIDSVMIERLIAIGTRKPALHDRPVYYSILLESGFYDLKALGEEILEYNQSVVDNAHECHKQLSLWEKE